jgi:predicted nicotinamide N-methyase
VTDALRTSLSEQLTRMRGSDAFPPPLLDIAREEVDVGHDTITVIRPSEWEELRHQEGADGRSAPYWAIAWPSGVELATRLAAMELAGKRVLELGCGLALPSIAAARRGAHVTATDGVPDAVVFAAHNLALNDVEGQVELVDWREAQGLVDAAPWDLVVASDVLYLRGNVEALLRLLPRLIGREGEAIVADPNRAGGKEFAASARRIFSLETEPGEKVSVHRLRPRELRREEVNGGR